MRERTTLFEDFLDELGLRPGQHVIVHASLRRLRSAFPGITAERLIEVVQQHVGPSGSVVMPAFTYCFKRQRGPCEVFDAASTPGKVGALSEVFRTMPEVVRTRSATHSFLLWGEAARSIGEDNAPESPLGDGSVLAWLAEQAQACALLLGVDFSALSFCHYLEVKAPVPWAGHFPWNHIGVLPVGVSVAGEQPLREVPGCSKNFVAFERYLLSRKKVRRVTRGPFWAYLLQLDLLLSEGLRFFRKHPYLLLCAPGTCPACDERRRAFPHGGTP
ncbi:MAG: AAC(3) family N-acetyltransferase [bacterium]|jgi:aminoglycoside N3'-acetyltransferase|nr:AAC(3) family N-acetyltransferase [candidate division KSB1 bacterium]MDH7559274.1 AAC(3) family N-acetyltransferase [bacterium]